MEKRILVMGLVFLFLFSSVVPISISHNVNKKNTGQVNNLDMQGGVSWVKKFGRPPISWDYFLSVCETNDGGYILLGTTSSVSPIDYDALFVKTDKFGNMEWQNKYGEPGPDNMDYPRCVKQAPDGGYIFCGSTLSYTNTTSTEIWLVKTDSKGNELWNKRYGNGTCFSVQNTVDGGYILTGGLFSPVCIYLLKTDKDGNELWIHKFFNGTGICVDKTTDGGYIVTGYTWHQPFNGYIGFLLKTDSNGIEQWNKTYDKPEGDNFNTVKQTPDGGFIIGAGCLIKTDEYGNELWNMTYKYSEYGVGLTKDGGYIITGGQGVSGVIKTDSSGDKEWQIDMVAMESELGKSLYSIQQTSDGGYIVAGTDMYYGLLIRVDIFENSPPSPPIVTGPKKRIPGLPLKYNAVSNDPDGDNISYFFDWNEKPFPPGKILTTGWTEPFGKSVVSRSHTYQDGTYHIRVKAMDDHYAQSNWTTFDVTIPRTRALYNSNWLSFLERFPIIQKLLNRIGQ